MRDGKYVVLCVDDDEDVLDALESILESHGYVATRAQSAAEGLATYDEVEPDFLFVDIMMEQMDAGLGLLSDLRTRGNKAPVYLLSSVGGQLAGMTSPVDVGAQGIMEKPVDSQKILNLLSAKLQ